MKKIYLFLTFLFTLVGGFFSPALAQDEEDVIQIPINANTGDYTLWNGNATNPWARGWKSNSEDPQVTISCGANNFRPWPNYSDKDFKFFNCVGGSGTSYTYTIAVSSGWEFVDISLDFTGSDKDKEIYVEVEDEKSAVNNNSGTADEDFVHFETTFSQTTSFGFTVGANSSSVFAQTKNFIVTVQRASALLVAIKELQAVMDQYRGYTVLEGDAAKQFVVGTEPGNYDADAVEAFNTAFQDCNEIEDLEEITVEIVNGFKDALVAAYQAVIDSRVTTMTLEDGYYRFRTGINYNDGTVKYMYVGSDGTKFTGSWGTIEDVANDCTSLFQVKNAEDGAFDIISIATDARFNENPATLSLESTNLLAIEPVVTLEGTTYVNLRISTQEAGKYNYFHQAGHGKGTKSSGSLTRWISTYRVANECPENQEFGGSEWAIEPVDAATAEAIIAAYAPTKEQQKLIINFKNLLAEANQAVKDAKDIQEYTDLITETSQFSSPWTEPSEGSLDNLIDNNLSTYWHSAWSGGSVTNHTHWLEVALNEPVYDLVQMKISRRAVQNDHITLWGVFGSNEQDVPAVLYTEADEEVINGEKEAGDVKVEGKEAEWTELASLSTPFGNNTETVTSKEFDTQGFQYLRFYIDGTTNDCGYGHVSEFQLVIPVPNENSQFAYMGEVATNLDALLKDLNNLTNEQIDQANYDALVKAYDAFRAQFVDPTELRELLASVEGIANGVEVGTNPGYWSDATTGDALKATYSEAKAYDEAGIYAAAKTDGYIETLKAQVEAVKAAVITIQEGKWYRFHFASEALFDKQEWDKVAGQATVKTVAEQEVQTDEALWSKFVTVATLDSDWYHVTEKDSVTVNTVVPIEDDEVSGICLGAGLFFDADEDIEVKDLSLFRFVGVGDTAYVIQNKATGMFLKAAGGSGAVTLSVHPSLFNVSAVGYGENVIAAIDLITADSQNYLHGQKAQNRLVTWNASTAGSASGLFIEEVEAVDTNYDGTAFQMSLKPGSLNSFCYPVGIAAPEDMELYDVVGVDVEEGVIQLNAIEKAVPGRPFIFIYEGDYVAEPIEDDSEPVTFYHDYSFTKEAIAAPFLKGTYSTIASLPKGAITTQGAGFVISKSATMAMISVPANSAYIQGEEEFPLLDEGYTYDIVEVEDGIAATLQKVAKSGELYTIDGRLLSRKANLNDLKRYGKGIYILNGVKVTVK